MLNRILVALITLPILCQVEISAASETLRVPLPEKESIVRLGAVPDPVTDAGRENAQLLFEGLNRKDKAAVTKAMARYESLMQTENIGGSYSALHWLSRTWLSVASGQDGGATAGSPLDQAYVDYFLGSDAQNLKEYLQRKYAVGNFEVKDPEQHMDRRTFLEDYIIFNNPARTQWDSTARVVEIISGLAPEVRRIIDVGAGFGYFSQRFAAALGETSQVYAVDTQQTYVDQFKDIVARYHIRGVQPLLSTADDVSVHDETDLVFVSSLYHVLYTWTQSRQRDAFMASIDRSLRKGGYLAILDNRDHAGRSLHNSFLSREAAIAQLYYYGYELVRGEGLSPYRYLLLFRKVGTGQAKPPIFALTPGQLTASVSSPNSLVHIGSLDSFDITPSGIAGAKLMLQALTDKDRDAARAARDLYSRIIPNENFGGEYTALQWMAEYIAGSPEEQRAMTQDPLAAEFYAYLADDDFARLKLYLSKKYKLEMRQVTVEEAKDEKTREIGIIRRQALEDFILFNNPKRESWEKSSRILELLPLKRGDTVVDIGSGPGFFSFKFADIVGPEGKVYAMDTKDSHVEYLSGLAKKWGLTQVRAALSATDHFDIASPGTADVVFMCSLYHIIYAVSSQSERDGMIASIIKALRPGGRFVVVDNGPVEEGKLPYHGPYIRQELIKAQLTAYGFSFESSEQIIPQRYLMTFRSPVPSQR